MGVRRAHAMARALGIPVDLAGSGPADVWALALGLGTLFQGVFTIAGGRLVFDADTRARTVLADYLRRARPTFECDWIEVRQHRASSESEAQRARDEEGERLLQRVPAGFRTIALDERGRMLDSPAFSTHLDNQRVASRSGVAFLIGGAFGHSAQLLQNVDEKLSLSPLTLPHSLALVVLAEQIYRAKTLIRGEPYHKM